MADSRFFERAGPFTLSQLAERAEAEIQGGAGDTVINDVAPLETAGADSISFLDNKKYVQAFVETKAGACLVHPDLVDKAPEGVALLVTKEPYQGYARIAQMFYPDAKPNGDIAASAVIDPTAKVGQGCQIAPGVVVGAGADIGDGTVIGPNTVVGDGVVLGMGCRIGPNVTLSHCVAGNGVTVHAGASIGQAGFGFAIGSAGFTTVPQLGRVMIGDGADIGANTTIDRGAGPDTVIGPGCRIDNLCQIAHNVELGTGCVLAAQVGISGSTKLGDFVMMGGQAGAAGHIKIGTGAKVTAQSGLMRDVEPGQTVAGTPASPAKEHWRQIAAVAKLSKQSRGKK